MVSIRIVVIKRFCRREMMSIFVHLGRSGQKGIDCHFNKELSLHIGRNRLPGLKEDKTIVFVVWITVVSLSN